MPRPPVVLDRRPDLPDSHYVDNRIYRDDEIFRIENEQIFSKVWKFVCHRSELPAPFDFRTVTVAGVPLVVVRNGDGELRSFVNVCSHRGLQFEERPAGNAKAFQCKFHLWTYDTAGTLVGMPRGEAYEPQGLDKADLGLRPVRVDEHHGMIFVNLDDNASSLADYLGNAGEWLEPVFQNQELEILYFSEQILHTNWKNWQETNMDGYHDYLHVVNRKTSLNNPESLTRKWVIYDGGHLAIEPFIVNYDSYDGMKPRSQLVFEGLEPSEFRVANFFPDVMVNCRSTVVRMDSQIPLGPDKTLVQFRGYGVKGESPEQRRVRAKHHNEMWGPFGRNLPEDMVVCEGQGKAMGEQTGGFTIWAREEDGSRMDDVSIRSWYAEWSKRTGINHARPFD